MNLEEIKAKYTEEEILKIKKNSREITAYAGDSLDKLVLQLENLRRQGKINCFVNFNGTKLYSIDVTMDSAYKECLGCTRKTWLKKEKQWAEDYKIKTEKWKKEAEENLPLWIEEGKKYTHPAKFESWEKKCISSANGDYYGLEIRNALEIMKLIEDGVSFGDIKSKIKQQGHSGMTYSKMMNIILYYAKRGPAFYNFMNKNHMSKFDKKYVSKIKELNKRILQGELLEEVCEDLKDHRIMEISIVSECNDEVEIFDGTILVNEDGTFEGIVDDNNIISGKLLGEKGIVFANFCNYEKASNYCGINEDGAYMGKYEIYSFNDTVDSGAVIIELKDSQRNFVSEIGVEYQIDKVKGYFNDYAKRVYNWYNDNMESEIDRILLSLKDGLEERMLNALKLRLKTIKEPQRFDVLAVPCKRAFVVAPEKAEEFKNSATTREDAEFVKKLAEQFRVNNLVEEGQPLVKKRIPPKNNGDK